MTSFNAGLEAAVVEAVKAYYSLTQTLADREAYIARLEALLEIDHAYRAEGDDLVRFEVPPSEREGEIDGIECRDATISGLKDCLADREAEIERLRGFLRMIRSDADYAGEAVKFTCETYAIIMARILDNARVALRHFREPAGEDVR